VARMSNYDSEVPAPAIPSGEMKAAKVGRPTSDSCKNLD